MRPTRWSDLVVVLIAAAALSWAVLLTAYDNLPTLPRTAMISIVILAVAGAGMWWSTRSRLLGLPGSTPITPLQLARIAPLGKALSIAGAVIAGGWLGLLIMVLPDLSVGAHRTDAITAALALLPSIATAASGLALERLCRVPPSDESSSDEDLP